MSFLGNLSLTDLLLFTALAALPVILWGVIFYRRDPQRLSSHLVVKTFLIGCFSVVPILAYEKVNNNYLVTLEKFKIIYLLSNNPVGEGILSFLTATIFLAVFLALTSAIVTFGLTLFSKETFHNIYNAFFLESLNFEVAETLIGFVIVIEIFVQGITQRDIVKSTVGTIMIAAIMEEYVKHLIVRFYDHRRIKSIDNAIAFSVLVGLGFAFIENIIYLNTFQENLWPVFFARTAAVLGHLCFSGIFGYYYGVAHFAAPILYENHVEGKTESPILRFLAKISLLKKTRVFREQKMFEGLVVATVAHSIYNFFLEMNITYVVVPFLFGLLYFVFYLLEKTHSQKQFGIIGTRTMPVEDYEALIWRINSIKWAQQIRAEHATQKKVEA